MPPPGTVQQTLEELLRLMPGADLRPGTMLRTLTEAAVRAGHELDVVTQGELLRTYLGSCIVTPEEMLQASANMPSVDEIAARLRVSDQMTRQQAMTHNFGVIYGGRQVGRSQRAAEMAAQQAPQHNWSIDPVNGSDANDGSPEAPLRTFAEFNRRTQGMPMPTQPMTVNVMADVPATDPIIGLPPNTHVVGQPRLATFNPRSNIPIDEAAQIARMRDQIMAEEDAEVFRHLDRVAAEGFDRLPDFPRFIDASYVYAPVDPNTRLGHIMPPREFAVTEEIGMAVVNPRGIQGRRVQFPEFEIAANPTIPLNELRERRFDLMERAPAPQEHPSLQEMQEIAHIIRRTVWQRLLDDPDF